MEYDNLAINVGLRFDSWNPKAADFKDYNNPYNMVVNSYILGTYTSLVPNRGENIKTYNYLSPRIAVSYQFLNNISVYSSFSKTFQPPPFSLVYSGYSKFSFLTTHRSSDNLSANRQPYKTTNYEVGTQWKISDMFALEVSAYSIDYHNYFDSSRLIKQASPLYYLHYSAGIAHSKGIEFTLEGIPTDVANFLKISGRLSYTYSKVKGDENLLGGSSNLTSGYNRDHRVVYTLSMLFPYDISVTSIGTFQSGFWYLKQLGGDEYAQGPWNKQIDLRIEKAFKISTFKLAVYMDVRNLFNTENIIAYDNSSTGYEVWEKNSDPTGQYNHSVSADGSLYYDIPREVYLGVSLDF
jgi:outer membrane receptor protein involved in Fe transport